MDEIVRYEPASPLSFVSVTSQITILYAGICQISF